MGHGFVSDPGRLTSLATTVYRLKQKDDVVTVSSQKEGEPREDAAGPEDDEL